MCWSLCPIKSCLNLFTIGGDLDKLLIQFSVWSRIADMTHESPLLAAHMAGVSKTVRPPSIFWLARMVPPDPSFAAARVEKENFDAENLHHNNSFCSILFHVNCHAGIRPYLWVFCYQLFLVWFGISWPEDLWEIMLIGSFADLKMWVPNIYSYWTLSCFTV